MSGTIEAFCTSYEHTIDAVGAISTLLAVVVSLFLAHRATISDNTKLVATLQISTVLHPAINPHPRFFVVSVTNTGKHPIQIPFDFFRWNVPLRRRQWVILPIDSTGIAGVIPEKTYPFEIKPRSRETFYMSEAGAFVDQMKGIKKEQGRLSHLLFFLKTASVRTTDGMTFRPKGDRTIAIEAAAPIT